MSIDITISFAIRFLLVYIFLRAALHKVRHYHDFYMQIEAYQLVPKPLIPAFSIFLPLVEGYLAFTFLVQVWLHPSFIAAALLSVYALAMSINLAKGSINLDCGCSGPSGFSQTISWALVIRNCVLVIFALATALPITARSLSLQDISTILLASTAVILIYASIEQGIANQQRQRQYFALKDNDSAGAFE